MAEAADILSADQMEDAIMDSIVSVDAARLEHLFGLVELPVPDTQRGQKNALRKTLMRFLCSPDGDGEERLEQWHLVFGDLFPMGIPKDEEIETTEGRTTVDAAMVNTEMVTDTGTGETAGLLADAGPTFPLNGGRGAPPVRMRHEDPMAMYSAVPPTEPVVRNNMATQRQQQVNPQSVTHRPIQQHREPRNHTQDEISISVTRT